MRSKAYRQEQPAGWARDADAARDGDIPLPAVLAAAGPRTPPETATIPTEANVLGPSPVWLARRPRRSVRGVHSSREATQRAEAVADPKRKQGGTGRGYPVRPASDGGGRFRLNRILSHRAGPGNGNQITFWLHETGGPGTEVRVRPYDNVEQLLNEYRQSHPPNGEHPHLSGQS